MTVRKCVTLAKPSFVEIGKAGLTLLVERQTWCQ